MPGKGTLGERLARPGCPSLLKDHYGSHRLYYKRQDHSLSLCVPRAHGGAAQVPIRSRNRGPHCPSVRSAEAGRRSPLLALLFVRTLVGFPERQPAANDAEGMV
jgi:hypothetical protein